MAPNLRCARRQLWCALIPLLAAPGLALPEAPPAALPGAVVLSWSAPIQNTDGTALTDLAGYRIYYGTSTAALTRVINIDTVGLLDLVIADLSPGTWYFQLTSVNAVGVESGSSSTVSEPVTAEPQP